MKTSSQLALNHTASISEQFPRYLTVNVTQGLT